MRRVRAGNYAFAAEVSRGTFLDCGREESRTKQSFAKDADINVLVQRFGVTGLAQRHPVQPVDMQAFDDVFDFQSAMNAIVDAQRAFAAVDARVRLRFGNDPQEFLMFCSDPKNSEEMVRLGLAIPRKKEDTVSVVKTEVRDDVAKPKGGKGGGGKPPKESADDAD